MLKECNITGFAGATLGLHLSREPWDPYPWVSGIQNGSSAQLAGIRCGDSLMQVNGCDILGKRIVDIADQIVDYWKTGATILTVIIWRNKNLNPSSDNNRLEAETSQAELFENDNGTEHDDGNISRKSLQKFATCLENIAQLLECPVCLEVTKPPGWQCCNGHVICNNCRTRSVKCPVCRVSLGPRGRCLLSDKLFTLLMEAFPSKAVRTEAAQNISSNKILIDNQNTEFIPVTITQDKTKELHSSMKQKAFSGLNENSYLAAEDTVKTF